MKTIFITHTAEPGGAELALYRYLMTTEMHVSLLTMQEGPLWGNLSRPNIGVYAVRPARTRLGQLVGLRRMLKEFGPATLVANSMMAALLCAVVKPRSANLMYWVRDGLQHSAMSKVGLFLTSLITLRRTSAVIANSQWTAATVNSISPMMETHVIPSPSGLSDTPGIPRTGPINPGRIRLLYLGRLSSWKGVHHAIDALHRLRGGTQGVQYDLTIAGAALFDEKDYEESLRQTVSSLGLEQGVTFLGHVDDVNQLLESHDVLLHCSVVPEPFGQVVVQGLGAGLAVIATDAGGPKEIISHGFDGLLYPSGDVDALVERVIQVVDKELLPSLSQNAIGTALMYSDTALVARIDEFVSYASKSHLEHMKK